MPVNTLRVWANLARKGQGIFAPQEEKDLLAKLRALEAENRRLRMVLDAVVVGVEGDSAGPQGRRRVRGCSVKMYWHYVEAEPSLDTRIKKSPRNRRNAICIARCVPKVLRSESDVEWVQQFHLRSRKMEFRVEEIVFDSPTALRLALDKGIASGVHEL